MPKDSVIVRKPQCEPVPVLATLPHGGTLIPDEFTAGIQLDTRGLWSDWYTTQLYSFLPEVGITVIEAALSVFVANVNQDPSGPLLGPYFRAVVPSATPWGEPVYEMEPSREERFGAD